MDTTIASFTASSAPITVSMVTGTPLFSSSIASAAATAIASSSPATNTVPEIEQFLPQGEIIWFEQSINAAVYIGAMAWGLHTAIFYQTVLAVWRNKSKGRWLWLSLTATLWAMATVNMCCNISFNERAWIDSPAFDGGAFAYFADYQKSPLNLAAVSVGVINLTLADAFMLYRVHVIWRKLYVTLILGIVYLASLVFAIFQCAGVAQDNDSFWNGPAFGIPFAYALVAMSLHVLFTVVLFGRLCVLRRGLSGPLTELGKTDFTSVKALIVESAVPYGVISCLALTLYCSSMTAVNLFLPLLVQLQGITPDLIIMRIVTGRAWSLNHFRAINEKLLAFRGELGHSVNGPGIGDISMATLEKESNHLSNNSSNNTLDPKVSLADAA